MATPTLFLNTVLFNSIVIIILFYFCNVLAEATCLCKCLFILCCVKILRESVKVLSQHEVSPH